LETGRQQPKSSAGKLIAVVIVLTLLAVLLVPGQKDSEKGESPEATSENRPSLLAGDDKGPGQAEMRDQAAATQGDAADLGPGSAARALIRELRSQTPPDLERAYRAAQKYQQAGQLDDAYLLYFYAAREGYGPAAMQLAREADPSSFKQTGLLDAPDELQANKWYSLAQQAGVADAAAALAKLRSAVEQKAEAGDAHARRIMLQWK
jgi:hypothetical protein